MPTDSYVLSDTLNRAVALTDSSAAITEAYDTDAYGVTRIFNAAGSGGDWFANDAQQANQPRNEFIFTGRRYDAESGNYYYRDRYYSSLLGRFLSRDGMKYAESLNLYLYVLSNPTKYLDPNGRETSDVVGGTVRFIPESFWGRNQTPHPIGTLQEDGTVDLGTALGRIGSTYPLPLDVVEDAAEGADNWGDFIGLLLDEINKIKPKTKFICKVRRPCDECQSDFTKRMEKINRELAAAGLNISILAGAEATAGGAAAGGAAVAFGSNPIGWAAFAAIATGSAIGGMAEFGAATERAHIQGKIAKDAYDLCMSNCK